MTITPELSSKPNRHGLHTVFLRVTVNRKHSRVNTHIKIDKKHWNKNGKDGSWIRKSEPMYRQLNAKIKKLLDEYSDSEPIMVSDYFARFMSILGKRISYSRRKSLESKLKKYTSRVPVDTKMQDVRLHDAQNYLNFLLDDISVNGAIEYFQLIDRVFKDAVKNKVISRNPFELVDLPRKTAVHKSRLTDSEVTILSASEVSEGDVKWNRLAVDMFDLSYYAAGIRVADLIEIRVGNFDQGRLTYEMNKNGKKKSIPINPNMQRILERYPTEGKKPSDYFFPILDANAPFAQFLSRQEKFKMGDELSRLRLNAVHMATKNINDALKRISAALGIKGKVTFHVSRHSFADKVRRMMKKDSTITWDGLRLMLGHSSLATTQEYLNQFDLEGQDAAHEAIWMGSIDVKAAIAASAQTLLTATSAGVCTPCVVKVISMLSIR